MDIPKFDKESAFDELNIILKTIDEKKISTVVKALQSAQNFIKKIHDDAYEKGYQDSLRFSEKINNHER